LRREGDERWEALQKIIEAGKKENIDILVISGDLFDREVNAEELRGKIRWLFSDVEFEILIIPGNHDREVFKSGLYFGEVHIFRDLYQPFEYENLKIWGFPFEPLEVEKIIYKLRSLGRYLDKDKINILLYHGELIDVSFSRNDFGEEGEERYMPVKLSYFKDLKIDYVLSGHFHSKFNIWNLENGGYFVYPGSPVSITKKDKGKRKVNLFEAGKPPKEYPLDTYHLEEVNIELDPFYEKNPLDIVSEALQGVHNKAKILLRVGGYIDSKKIKMSETELIERIKRVVEGKTSESPNLEFRDISRITEDSLFKSFMKKLEEKNYDEKNKRELLALAIKAMSATGL
jgi:DNA repair exonuclease SbcCD nuclease subunit